MTKRWTIWLLMLALGAGLARADYWTPLLRAYLRSDLDGRGFALTNVVIAPESVTGLNNALAWLTNAASGGSGTGGQSAETAAALSWTTNQVNLLQAQASNATATASNALSVAQGVAGSSADAMTNAVTISRKLVAATMNSLTVPHGGWVDLGSVSNFAGIDWTVLQGMPILYISTDGGASWTDGGMSLITNTTVWLKVTTYTNIEALDKPIAALLTNLVFYTVERPDKVGTIAALYGQDVRVGGTPATDDSVVNRGYVQNLFKQTPWWVAQNDVQLQGHALNWGPEWQTTTEVTSNRNEWSLSFLGSKVVRVAQPRPTPVNGVTIAMDSTGTNCVVKVPTNGLSSPPRLQVTHALNPPNWAWMTAMPSLSGTNYVFTFPGPFADTAFFRSLVPSAEPGEFALAGLLQLSPGTVYSNTASTYGLGAGLVRVDTNYVYVSVGTNAWGRVPLVKSGW